MFLKFDPLIRL
jgi:hypothetical protein